MPFLPPHLRWNFHLIQASRNGPQAQTFSLHLPNRLNRSLLSLVLNKIILNNSLPKFELGWSSMMLRLLSQRDTLPQYFSPDGFFGGNNLLCYLAYRKAFQDIFLVEETFISPSLRLK